MYESVVKKGLSIISINNKNNNIFEGEEKGKKLKNNNLKIMNKKIHQRIQQILKKDNNLKKKRQFSGFYFKNTDI